MNARPAISDREQLELLQEEILWLRGELGILQREEHLFELRQAFGLTRREAQLLATLVNSKLMTKDIAIHAMLEPGSDDFPDDKLVDVFVCKLRAKLAPLGITIETTWGNGYFLPKRSRRRIAEELGQVP